MEIRKLKSIIITSVVSIIAIVGCVNIGLKYEEIFNSENDNLTRASYEISESIIVEEVEEQSYENLLEIENYVDSPEGITAKAKSLLKINDDIIGWIKIDGTDVDYPVVLDHGSSDPDAEEAYEANSYYLERDLEGNFYRSGTIFLDYRNVFGADEDEQSDNIVIYGHNMANDTAFGSLSYYRTDYSFYDKNPIICLSSNYEDYEYVIFGMIITSGNWDTDFRYWDMEEFETEDDFNLYVDTIRRKSLVDTGIDVEYSDQLITLSTCYSNTDNSRFLVVGRKLRDGETTMDNVARTEEYILEHSQE